MKLKNIFLFTFIHFLLFNCGFSQTINEAFNLYKVNFLNGKNIGMDLSLSYISEDDTIKSKIEVYKKMDLYNIYIDEVRIVVDEKYSLTIDDEEKLIFIENSNIEKRIKDDLLFFLLDKSDTFFLFKEDNFLVFRSGKVNSKDFETVNYWFNNIDYKLEKIELGFSTQFNQVFLNDFTKKTYNQSKMIINYNYQKIDNVDLLEVGDIVYRKNGRFMLKDFFTNYKINYNNL